VDLNTAVETMIEALDQEQIDYMLVGSFSSNFYGIPRSTQGADLVLQLPDGGMQRLRTRLKSTLNFDPQTTFESVTATICTRVYVPDSMFKLELFRLSGDSHDQERFQRRVKVPYLNRHVWLPTAEDVIITKIRWAVSQSRPKDVMDVREVLAVQYGRLDWDYLIRWTDEHGSRSLLEKLQAEAKSVQ
jgi:hypothetical protein